MNTDQFQSLIRQALTLGGTLAVTAFHAAPDAVATYGGAASVLASVIWSLFAHKAA